MVIRRKGSWQLSLVLGIAVLFGGSVPARAEVIGCSGAPALRKLTRGVANTITGIFEIPLTIQEIGTAEGPAAGITLGLVNGIGAAVVRTAVGLAEVVTFPFPMPRIGYEPILQPEFLFEPGNPH